MAVGEHDRGTAGGGSLELGDERVTARPNLVQGLTAGTAIAEQVPSRMLFVDLSRRQTLVRPVVVLGEGVDHRGFDAGHAAASRFHGSLQRTGEDHRQGPFRQGGQQRWQTVGLTETLVDQWQVGASSVATVLGPFRGTVAHQEDELGAGDDGIGHDVIP